MTRGYIFICLLIVLSSCKYFTYVPKGKRHTQMEKPSIVLLNAIIDYRLEHEGWPYTKEEFMSKGPKYRHAFDGFPYGYVYFKVIDNDKMTFYFSDHIKDRKAYEQTGKIDLNSYGGNVRFYKEKDKFIWKLKMQ